MGSKLVSQLEEITDQLLSNADDLVAQSRQHVAALKDGLAKADDAVSRYSKRRQMVFGRNQ
jgi:ABC-type transporter Mla subunit MlaD